MKRALAERAKQQTNEQQLQQRSVPVLASHPHDHHPHHQQQLPLPPQVSTAALVGVGFVEKQGLGVGGVEGERPKVTTISNGQQDASTTVTATSSPIHSSDMPPKKIQKTTDIQHAGSASTVIQMETETKNHNKGQNISNSSNGDNISSEERLHDKDEVAMTSCALNKKSKKRIRPPSASTVSVVKLEKNIGTSMVGSSSWSANQNLSQQDSQQQQQQQQQQADDSSAFFLKHQNKALASELYQYRHTIGLLTRERETRRLECRKISEFVKQLVCVWDTVQEELAKSLGQQQQQQQEWSHVNVRCRRFCCFVY